MNERDNIQLARLHSDMQSALWGEPFYEYTPEDLDRFRKKSPEPNLLKEYDILDEVAAVVKNISKNKVMEAGKEYELPIDYINEAFQ